MGYRFYLNKTYKKTYLQLWHDKENCISLGTAESLVTTLLDENKTKELMDKVTKFIKGEM
jgi:hypothetical protein